MAGIDQKLCLSDKVSTDIAKLVIYNNVDAANKLFNDCFNVRLAQKVNEQTKPFADPEVNRHLFFYPLLGDFRREVVAAQEKLESK